MSPAAVVAGVRLIIDIFAGFYVAVVMSYLFGSAYRGDAASAPPAAPTM